MDVNPIDKFPLPNTHLSTSWKSIVAGGRSITAIMRASQAWDAGSTPAARTIFLFCPSPEGLFVQDPACAALPDRDCAWPKFCLGGEVWCIQAKGPSGKSTIRQTGQNAWKLSARIGIGLFMDNHKIVPKIDDLSWGAWKGITAFQCPWRGSMPPNQSPTPIQAKCVRHLS